MVNLKSVKIPAPSEKGIIFYCFLLLLLIFLVYSNSLEGSFHYDDLHHIKRNFNIRRLSNIPYFFVNPRMFSEGAENAMYRPFLLTTYAINYAIHGNNVIGYHIVNVLLHGMNSALVFLVFIAFFRSHYTLTFLLALIYGVNPINTEAVNYLSSRSDVLSTTFFLLAFYLFMRAGEGRSRIGLYLLVPFFYILGLLTKEVVITLPVILILYDLLFDPASPKIRIKKHLPVWIVTVLYLLLRMKLMGSSGIEAAISRTTPSGIPAGEWSYTTLYQLTQIKVILNYLRMWFIPTGLTIEHRYPLIESITEPSFLASLFLFLLLLAGAIYCYKWERRITFFYLWFLITLLPTSLLPLNVVMAEKRVYIAGIGLAGVTLSVGRLLLQRFSPKGETFYAIVVFFPIIAIFATGTFLRNSVWKDEISLWEDAVKKSPHSYVAYHVLAEAYLTEALRLQPRPLHPLPPLGVKFMEKAIANFQKAISFDPEGKQSGPIYNGLGVALYRIGRVKEAIEVLKKGIAVFPELPELYNSLGNAYSIAGEYDRAIEAYKKAIALRPEFSIAYNNLGNAYSAKGEYNHAIPQYRKALEIDPTNTMAYMNLKRVMKILYGR